MVERKLDAGDTTLRNSVVFKVVQALRHAAKRKLVRMVEKRKSMCASGRPATPSRCGSLPIAGPVPADRGSEHAQDQPIGEDAVTLVAVVFEPGRVPGIGSEIFAAHRVMLAADHAAEGGGEKSSFQPDLYGRHSHYRPRSG
jgi:hypothetical protein